MTDLSAINRNYREIGDTTLAAVTPLLQAKGSPMVATAAATHAAAKPHSGLWWGQTGFENQWSTTGEVIQPEDHNPAALRPWVGDPTATRTGDVIDWKTRRRVGTIKVPPYAFGAIRDSGGDMMLRFPDDASCAREWKRRMTDPAYKNGVYTGANTLWEMLNIYCPPNDKPHPVTGVPNSSILPQYHSTVVSLLERLSAAEGDVSPGGPPMEQTLNFDPKLVPMPPHRFKLATSKRPGVGMNRFGPRVHRGNVFHRAVSGNQSLDIAVGWLLRSDVQGLTDGFIDHCTGEMVIINPMKAMFPNAVPSNWQDMAGWAQGPYNKAGDAWPDGIAFRNRYGGRLGADIINQDLESMEITGDYGSPISEACKATLVQWTAARAQYHKIPWDKFPIIPSTGLTMIYGHREFCGDTHKVCPGWVVWDFINGELVIRVQAILKKAQTTAVVVPPPVTKPEPVDPWPYAEAHIPEFVTNPEADPYLEDGNGTTLFWTDKQYVAIRPTKRLQYAFDGAPEVGPVIPTGMDFNIAFIFTAHNGKEYGLTPYGTRVLLDDLKVVSAGALAA